MIENIVLVLILGIAAWNDLKERIVPNKLIYTGIMLGAVLAFFKGESTRVAAAILVFLFLYIVLYRIFYIDTLVNVIYKILKINKKFNVEPILPGGDIKSLTFIFMAKGHSIAIPIVYRMLIISIPFFIYYFAKEIRNGTKEIIPLVVPMFIATCIELGVLYAKII